MTQPFVSICCVTYNHAPFIRQCLEGFLMQQPPASIINSSLSKANQSIIQASWLEILIHDDCSTDGTTEIVREYAAKYPDIIKPLYETENQFSKPGRESMDFYNYRRARGKYIAYCEGDDYWTDPLKLQKQVDFMEAHPEYSVCWCQADITMAVSGIIQQGRFVEQNTDVSAKEFLVDGKGAPPLTMVFRVSNFSFEWSKHYTCYLDTMEIYHLLKVGKGIVLNFKGGVYRIHKGGISSSMSDKTRSWENVRDGYEMYHYCDDEATREMYIKSIWWRLEKCNSDERKQLYNYIIHHTPYIGVMMWFKEMKHVIKKYLHK